MEAHQIVVRHFRQLSELTGMYDYLTGGIKLPLDTKNQRTAKGVARPFHFAPLLLLESSKTRFASRSNLSAGI
jgi:hypothetical protein